jgi:hypothetical protein
VSEWSIVGYGSDPVPGDVWAIRAGAQAAQAVATVAEDAFRDVGNLVGDDACLRWIGQSGDKFKSGLGDLPPKIQKVAHSYQTVFDALTSWASALDGFQQQARKGLAQAENARTAADKLEPQIQTAQSNYDYWHARLKALSKQVPPPDPSQISAAVHNANAYAAQVTKLQNQHSSQIDLISAGKALVDQARTLRDEAAKRVGSLIDSVAHDAIKAESLLHTLAHWAHDAWDWTMRNLDTITLVFAIAACILGGPWLWGIVIGLTLLSIGQDIDKIAHGDHGPAVLFDLGMDILTLLPPLKILKEAKWGVRLFEDAGRAKAMKSLEKLWEPEAITRSTRAALGKADVFKVAKAAKRDLSHFTHETTFEDAYKIGRLKVSRGLDSAKKYITHEHDQLDPAISKMSQEFGGSLPMRLKAWRSFHVVQRKIHLLEHPLEYGFHKLLEKEFPYQPAPAASS